MKPRPFCLCGLPSVALVVPPNARKNARARPACKACWEKITGKEMTADYVQFDTDSALSPRTKAPATPELAEAIRLMRNGMTIGEAAKAVGLASPTVEKGWLRWIVLPEWLDFKKHPAPDMRIVRKLMAENQQLREAGMELRYELGLGPGAVRTRKRMERELEKREDECQRLAAELADYMMRGELDAIAATPDVPATDCAPNEEPSDG